MAAKPKSQGGSRLSELPANKKPGKSPSPAISQNYSLVA
jgi:hypothetical protein